MDNASNMTSKESVPCTLEYFSEVTHTFNYYAKFYIKQDERLKLDLSQFNNCYYYQFLTNLFELYFLY